MLIPPKTPTPKADRILSLEVYRKSILISETAFSKSEDVLFLDLMKNVILANSYNTFDADIRNEL